jgi:hypothetical protein
MLSEELIEAQNSVGRLNTLLYTAEGEHDDIPASTLRYGAMLVEQFDECFTAYLDATEEYETAGNFDRDSPDYLYEFINNNLQSLQLRSVLSLAELLAVLKAQPKRQGENTTKAAFALTAENKETLSSFEIFLKSKVHQIRMQLIGDTNSDDIRQTSLDGRLETIEPGDQNNEFWADLDWINVLLENPDHPVHSQFSKHDGFYIGPSLETAITLTREHMEFFASIYFYMQRQSGLNNTEIPQSQVDYFTDGVDEISVILTSLRNLTFNDTGITLDNDTIEEAAQIVQEQFGQLRPN